MANLRVLSDDSRSFFGPEACVPRRPDSAPDQMLHFERVPNRIRGNSSSFLLFRTKVPGGWLVAMRPSDSVAFVPDPEHEWLVSTPVD